MIFTLSFSSTDDGAGDHPADGPNVSDGPRSMRVTQIASGTSESLQKNV